MLTTKASRMHQAHIIAICTLVAAVAPVSARASCDDQFSYKLAWDNEVTDTVRSTGSQVYAATNGAGSSIAVTLRSNIDSNADVLVVKLAFATAVRDVHFTVPGLGRELRGQADWITATGMGPGGVFPPAITSPPGNRYGASPGQAHAQDEENVTISFVQPVTAVEVHLSNASSIGVQGLLARQSLGIHDFTFCPMPVLALEKTAQPFAAAPGRPQLFNAPGSDIVYSLTVSNSGGGPVDANSIVLDDVLPGQMSFYNGDIDDGGPMTANYEFVAGSSGLTLSMGNLSYSNNGGSSYAYSPSPGYDAAVNAIRLKPQGTMAANSSFTVKFRAQIK